ncbi:heat shock protein HtpX [Nocardia africana]|uniref:Heat shock protein HtpX n=2 Tax=Nocardia africana TaxID=134964 RepID=A0A378X2U4_9NOCA|nr:heat shock protein HtpX [Nocardia africana]
MLRRADPRLVLMAWASLLSASATLLMAPLFMSLAPRHGGPAALMSWAHRCLPGAHDAVPARLVAAIGIVGVAVSVTAAIRFALRWRALSRQRSIALDKHRNLSRILHGTVDLPVLWLPSPAAFAYSLAGRPAMIVAGRGLTARLDPAAVGAVLAHEHAHVRGRHHLLVTVAEAVAYAVPWLPVARCSPELVRALVELDADGHAAEMFGTAAVHRALTRLRDVPAPTSALAIAEDCVELRLARLAEEGARNRINPRRAAAAALAAPALPVLLLVATFVVTSCGK